jgi:8-oxo-dGTP pyrophosphatase MutT (NUDIX family)
VTGDATDVSPGFRVRGQTTVWTGQLFYVAIAEVETPDGELLQRDIMRHPGAVGVVPLHSDETVTLVRQYRAALDTTMWEIPAGLRDRDDEPAEITARRELSEEAGLATDHLQHLMTFHNSPGATDEAVDIFLATGLSSVPDDRQGTEEQHMTLQRVSLSEAIRMVDGGRITDAKTVIGLLLTQRALSR